MTTPRPFAADYRRSQAPGELRFDLTFAAEAPPATQDTVRLLLGEVGAFVACGALGGERVDPAHVTARADAPIVHASGASLRLSDVRVDPGVVPCLVNIATWTHHQVVALAAVRVWWDQLSDSGRPPSLEFPAAWPGLAFGLDVDGERDRRFAIEVNLRQAQPEVVRQAINEHIFVWYTGANRGAYGTDDGFPPQESGIYLGDDTVQSLPAQLTWFIDAFRCSEAALDGLVNTLHKIHHTHAAISEVVIG